MLRGLGVTWVLVHSEIMEAFQPGRAAALRTRLEQAPGIEHVQDFGPEWMYRVRPAELPPITGEFWSTADGHAGLILRSAGATETVIPPGTTFEVTAHGRRSPVVAPQRFRLSRASRCSSAKGAVWRSTCPGPLCPAATGCSWRPRTGMCLSTMLWWRSMSSPVRRRFCRSARSRSRKECCASRFRRAKSASAGACSTAPTADVTVRLRLLDAAGQEIGQNDQSLGGTSDLVNAWRPRQTVTTTHSIALPDDALGVYSVEASVFATNDPITYFFLADEGTPVETLTLPFVIRPQQAATVDLPPAMPLAEFGTGVYLLDSKAQPPAQTRSTLRDQRRLDDRCAAGRQLHDLRAPGGRRWADHRAAGSAAAWGTLPDHGLDAG